MCVWRLKCSLEFRWRRTMQILAWLAFITVMMRHLLIKDLNIMCIIWVVVATFARRMTLRKVPTYSSLLMEIPTTTIIPQLFPKNVFNLVNLSDDNQGDATT